MKEAEMRLIGGWIASVIKDVRNEKNIQDVHGKVETLSSRFTLYPE
jgi:glycine hydroxymethyltransferase